MAAQLRNFLALLLLVAACLPLTAQAQAMAHVQTWESLNIHQKQALGPLSITWNSLSEKQQKNFISIAEHYPKLTPQKQQRLHAQMEKWSKLTPEQRNRAREKYKAFNKVPAEQREAVKKMVREQQASQAASSVPPVPASP
jgi:hypothetical protein